MNQLQEQAAQALALCLGETLPVSWRSDAKGVVTGWCRLPEPAGLLPAAQTLADLGARLSMVSAYLAPEGKLKRMRELAYHFDLDGSTLTLTLELPVAAARVPSLTPIFRNADWNEREFRELYDIEVIGHPDPRPLFLDPSIEPAAFERLIPYSTFSSGASGKALWQKVQAAQEKEVAP